MPETRHSHEALARRQARQAWVEAFPGRLAGWEAAAGKTVAGALPSDGLTVVLFTDGTFLLLRPGQPSAEEALQAIEAARKALQPHWPEALAELDHRLEEEREAMRLARMEKVLGAVETNLPRIPELREALERLLHEL